MASLVLIAVMVSAYSGIFLTCIWLGCVAERDLFPVRQTTQPLTLPAAQPQATPRRVADAPRGETHRAPRGTVTA